MNNPRTNGRYLTDECLPTPTEERSSIEQMDVAKLLEGTTPGPWFASPYRGAIGSQVWAGEPGPSAILILEEGDADRDADARLIAAAPRLAREHIEQADLIEAITQQLSEAREALGKIAQRPIGGEYTAGTPSAERMDIIIEARAALATKEQSNADQ